MHHVVYVSLLLLLSAASRTSPSTVDPGFDYTGRSAEFKAAVERCEKGLGYVRLDHDAQYHSQSLLEMKTPKYLKEFSNPCWIECYPEDKDNVYHKDNRYWSHRAFIQKLGNLAESTSNITRKWRLRCLPKFYVIGMPKCGTTDLFKRITSHPDVTLIGGKEINWWSNNPLSENDIFNLERYMDIADLAVDRILEDFQVDPVTGQLEHPVVFGDGTPSTMFRNYQWRKYTGDIDNDSQQKFLTPVMMSHVQPDAKLIAILRDPVQMTFSSYKFFHPDGASLDVEVFHKCVVESIKAFLDCEKHHSNNWCSYIKRSGFNFTGNLYRCNFVLRSLQLGRYYSYLKEWFKFFPKEQFFIIKMEEYSLQKKKTIEEIWRFLGLRHLPLQFALHMDELEQRNVSNYLIGKMKLATKKLLEAFFSSSNIKLARMLNKRKFLWLD